MRRQLPRHRLDALDDAGWKISRFEISLHLGTDYLPAGGADLGVDAAIGDDLDVAVRQQQVDQHTIVVSGVPDAKLRKNIQRALPRRLIAEQRRAIERAFHGEADLAGMGGLAGLDRLLDRSQYARRKNPPHPPAVLKKMPADAPDVHAYQLPDAPPPPKLPPPPEPQPPPDQLAPRPYPPYRLLADPALSANMVTMKAMTPAMIDAANDPAMDQARAPTMPPVAAAPISLPSAARRMAPRMKRAKMTTGLSGSTWLSNPELCRCRGSGAGSFSPSITATMRSTPADIPPAKSPLLNFGVMTSSMMRLAVTSLSTPSSP